ncbi:MAG: peptidylprolyl isomerase [Methylovulum miyakonense]|uniref:peptidylprolyl isomerase n=1 Tax=Methylovulum miyakonense TaxID=645578 RepID=UPI003BB529E2
MKKTLIPLLVAGTALIATGCDQKATTDASAPVINKADAIAIVNGKYIAKATFDSLEKEIAERSQGQAFPKEKLLEELIQRELLVQDAIQKQLDKTPEVADRLEEAKKSILTQAEVQNFMKANPVTDAEIKAEYDSKVGAGSNNTEYKARHILVKTEAEAKKLIAELDKGADFAKLANKNSLDGKEAQNGGDLGWFVAGQMVEPFSKAVIALEKGKYTKEPVQTQFGWHVILREDSRAQTPPPLEAVKEQLMPMLQRKKVQDMLENLRKQAKVEILMKDEPAKPAEAPKPAAEAAKPVTEEVVVEEEIKDKDGKTVAKETIVEEVTEEKAPAAEEKKPEAAKPAVEKKK